MQQSKETNLSEKEQETVTISKTKPLAGSNLWGILFFFILILIDQLTKILADVIFIDENGTPIVFELIPDFVKLTITYNRGISFGIGSTAGMGVKIAVLILTAVVMIALAIMYFKCDKRRTLMRIALVLIVAGGVGNLIDRVYYQVWDPATDALIRDGVRDMVDISAIGFGVCNFADFFISGGAVLLVIVSLFFDTYAFSPKGKYKALQEEAEAEERMQAEMKKQKKLLKNSQGTEEPQTENGAHRNG